MSVRSLGYDSDNLDQIVCYFMKTILHLQTSGVENLPLENKLAEPWKAFLDTAMKIFLASPSPELSRLILEAEHNTILQKGQISKETVLGLQLIKELTWHIHYDEDYYGYLLSTENIWGNHALAFATQTFYPNLPEHVKNKYDIPPFLQHIPENVFRLDDD